MALFTECWACELGYHEGHIKVLQAPPQDGVGGAICACNGECKEKNKQEAAEKANERLFGRKIVDFLRKNTNLRL